MKVNRFTNVQPAQYNPMGLQELMMVPMMKREQHDKLNTDIATTRAALAQTDYMDIHGEQVSGLRKKLESELQRQVDQVSSTGIDQTLRTDFTNLNASYQSAIGPKGLLGAAANAKSTFKAEKDTYMANATAIGYSPDRAAYNWEKHVQDTYSGFDGEGKIANVDGLYAPKYFDVAEETMKLAKDAKLSETDIANMGSTITTDAKGQYVLNEGSRNIDASNLAPLKAMVMHMNNQISNPNSPLKKSMDHQGVTSEDALQMVAGLTPIYAQTKTGRSTTKAITGFKSAAELGIGSNTGALNYEYTEAEAIQVRHGEQVSALRDIQEGNATPGAGNVATSGASGPSINKDDDTPPALSNFVNRFSAEERDEMVSLYERIKDRNPNLKNMPFGSQAAAGAMADYLEGNQNILRQNIIITDDFFTTYGENSVGTEKTSRAKIQEGVFANIETRSFAVDGEVLTFNELPEDVKVNYRKQLTYGGYASPKNFLSRQFNSEEQNKNMFGSPLKFSMQDDEGNMKTIYVSRSGAEMESPGYQADLVFNDVFTNTNEYPDLPYRVETADGIAEITYNSKTKSYSVVPDPTTSGFKAPIQLTESQLQSSFYNSMGVAYPGKK